MSNSSKQSTAATGSLLESGSTLEQSNNGNDASKHINDDKPVSHVRVDTGKDSETDLPDPKLEKMAVSSKNIRKTIVPALSSRKLCLGVNQHRLRLIGSQYCSKFLKKPSFHFQFKITPINRFHSKYGLVELNLKQENIGIDRKHLRATSLV